MRIRHTFYVAIFFLVACGTESSVPDDVLVFADGALQCEPPMLLEENAQLLTRAGIDVRRSSCGVKSGISVASVCGGPSLNILVHEISAVNLQDAERLGFQSIDVLVDDTVGTGYELTEC